MKNAIPASLSNILKQKPAKMFLANLTNLLEVEAQFNPTEFHEKIAVNYTRLGVLGMSHQPMQYQNTGNLGIDFELAFRQFDDRGNRVLTDIQFTRKFMHALAYPRRGASDVIGGAPPRCLVVWPNLCSLTCVLTQLEYTFNFFALDGSPIHALAKVTFEEIRDVRLTMEDVLADGLQRSPDANKVPAGDD